jgi:hypothetical protein
MWLNSVNRQMFSGLPGASPLKQHTFLIHDNRPGCIWLYVDFAEALESFYLNACGFIPANAGRVSLGPLEVSESKQKKLARYV